MALTISTPTASPIIALVRPDAGQTVTIPVNQDNMPLSIGFTLDSDAIVKEGQNLVFTFEDGGKILLQGYYDHFADQTLPIMVSENGDQVSGEDFLASLNKEELLTAAGPSAGAGAMSGGSGAYADDAGALMNGVDRLDSLGALDSATSLAGGDAGIDGNAVPAFILADAAALPGAAPGGDTGMSGNDGGMSSMPDDDISDSNPPSGVATPPALVNAIDESAKISGENIIDQGRPCAHWQIGTTGVEAVDLNNQKKPDASMVRLTSGGTRYPSLTRTFEPDEVEGGYIRFRLDGDAKAYDHTAITMSGQEIKMERGGEGVWGDSAWFVTIGPIKEADTYELTITVSGGTITCPNSIILSDFAVGEHIWTTGNVLSNDEIAETARVASFSLAGGEPVSLPEGADHVTVNVDDGYSFTMYASGKYCYTGDGDGHAPASLDVTYQVRDGGATDTATLHLRDNVIEVGPETQFFTHHTSTDEGDIIYGKLAAGQTLDGGLGDDVIYGAKGGDTIYGGEGNDVLYGGQGGDYLSGGQGGDVFSWRAQDLDGSTDYIMDFNIGEGDKLRFADFLGSDVRRDDLLGKSLTAEIKEDHLEIRLESIAGNQTVDVIFNGEVTVNDNSYKDFSSFADAYADANTQTQQDMMNSLLTTMMTTG